MMLLIDYLNMYRDDGKSANDLMNEIAMKKRYKNRRCNLLMFLKEYEN